MAGGSSLEIIGRLPRAGRRFFLQRGSVECSVPREARKEALTVETRHADTVVKGTVFTVADRGNSTRVEVRRGRVLCTRKTDGAAVPVAVGQCANIASLGELDVQPLTTRKVSLYTVRTVSPPAWGPPTNPRLRSITRAGECVWVLSLPSILSRIDTRTGKVMNTLNLGKTCTNIQACGLGWDGESLWVGNARRPAAHAIDPVTGKERKAYRAPAIVKDLTTGDGFLWTLYKSRNGCHIGKLDLRTGAQVGSFRVPLRGGAGAITYRHGTLWLDTCRGAIFGVHAGRARILSCFQAPPGSRGLTSAGEGRFWVCGRSAGTKGAGDPAVMLVAIPHH
jgi:hypothetical protein